MHPKCHRTELLLLLGSFRVIGGTAVSILEVLIIEDDPHKGNQEKPTHWHSLFILCYSRNTSSNYELPDELFHFVVNKQAC